MGSDGEECSTILYNMLDNSEWSDLKIRTASHTFDVHKSVVCPACPFFKAACTGDWKEAGAGIIELPESEHTIRSLLQWCYGVFDSEHFSCSTDELRCLQLLVAADKYQLPGLKQEVKDKLEHQSTASGDMETALWIYQEDRRQVIGAQRTRDIVDALATKMAEILEDGRWEKIQSCPELCKDLFRFVAQRSSRVLDRDKLIDPEHLREPTRVAVKRKR